MGAVAVQAEEAARWEESRGAETAKLARERRVLDKQSKALLKLPNKKERSALDGACSQRPCWCPEWFPAHAFEARACQSELHAALSSELVRASVLLLVLAWRGCSCGGGAGG